MKLQTMMFQKNKGWSNPFPQLDSEQTLVLIFGAPEFIDHPEPINELVAAFPTSKIIGCSSAGEIFDTAINDKSLSVAIMKFDAGKIKVTSAEISDVNESHKAGETLLKTLMQDGLKSIFVLSDGLKVNGSELVKGMNSDLPKDVVITGGLAGDGERFKKTWVIVGGKFYTNKIVAVGFYGKNFKIGHGSKGGWDSFGPERRITRSKANILYELDGRPALELYKEYLGDRASELPASGLLFPLMIHEDKKNASEVVRTILAIDEKNQSLTFAGDVPEGYRAQLMRANFDRLVTGAGEAALSAAKNATAPVLSVAISCVGRRLLMGERTEEETQTVLESLPQGTQQVGFYSYGEISPFSSGNCELHNQTMTLTTFSEE